MSGRARSGSSRTTTVKAHKVREHVRILPDHPGRAVAVGEAPPLPQMTQLPDVQQLASAPESLPPPNSQRTSDESRRKKPDSPQDAGRPSAKTNNHPTSKETHEMTTETSQKPVHQTHVMMTVKGGSGKTTSCAFLAEAYQRAGRPVVCIDTDNETKSLAKYPAIKAEPWQITKGESKELDLGRLDPLLTRIMDTPTDFIVDSGSNSSAPLRRHLVTTDFANALTEVNKRLVLHLVLEQGQHEATVDSLIDVLEEFNGESKLVVWLNEYKGPIKNAKGQPFVETPLYLDNKERILSVITLPEMDSLHTAAVQLLISKRLTFTEALANEHIERWTRQRLQRAAGTIFPAVESLIN